jgi:hypothetical protein
MLALGNSGEAERHYRDALAIADSDRGTGRDTQLSELIQAKLRELRNQDDRAAGR